MHSRVFAPRRHCSRTGLTRRGKHEGSHSTPGGHHEDLVHPFSCGRRGFGRRARLRRAGRTGGPGPGPCRRAARPAAATALRSPPPPRPGFIWAPGYWEPRGHRYVWRTGHWERARPGYRWRAPAYREHDGHWQHVRGGWDRDGDGVPNRYDHRPDDPYRH
ncbi:hypothetical protein [Xylophilus sp.]|uniref:hypothetical protein n=1 Tax=Xylophilus sp. TaxID=2653893 RepID=UPI003FCD4DF0